MRLAIVFGWGLLAATPCLTSCANRPALRLPQQVAQNPCDYQKTNDACVAQLPAAPPIVAGEGKLWAVFADAQGFSVRQFSEGSQQVIATGTCPTSMKPALLGAVEARPAVLCVNFSQARFAYGAANSGAAVSSFTWQNSEQLQLERLERLREVSHFAWQNGKLAILYRTGAANHLSDDAVTDDSPGGASGTVTTGIGSEKWWLHVDGVNGKSEPICPRAGVARCGTAPLTFYAAEGQLHVVLPNGKGNGGYLHVAYLPGQSTKLLPVADVPSTGKSLTAPCVSGSPDGSLRVYTPMRTLVSSLMGSQGERMGLIEHRAALVPQGSEVYAQTQMRCPPEVQSLGSFPKGHVGTSQVGTHWLRATRAKDTWVLGYAVSPFAVQHLDVTYRYSESFWVLTRHNGQ